MQPRSAACWSTNSSNSRTRTCVCCMQTIETAIQRAPRSPISRAHLWPFCVQQCPCHTLSHACVLSISALPYPPCLRDNTHVHHARPESRVSAMRFQCSQPFIGLLLLPLSFRRELMKGVPRRKRISWADPAGPSPLLAILPPLDTLPTPQCSSSCPNRPHMPL